MEAHISRENMISFLLTTPMFDELDPHEIRKILHIVDAQQYKAGETLFREGDNGDAWYALYSGEVELLKETGGRQKVLGTLGPRSCFGEISVLDKRPRSATIRASKDTVALRVPQDKFNELVEHDHETACKLIKHMALTLASRERTNTEILSRMLLVSELSLIHENISEIVSESTLS